jgi:sporulation protein YlmC with PRC-barrel domain
MRLSELLRCTVDTVDGARLGHVHDVLLVQDGPPASEFGAYFRVHGLAVGPHSIGTRLGITQGHVERPALLRRVFGWSAVVVPWSAVREIDAGTIVVDVAGLDLRDASSVREETVGQAAASAANTGRSSRSQ